MTVHQQLRLQNWRLKIIQHTQSCGNVAKTCRHFGISRSASAGRHQPAGLLQLA